MKARVVDWWNDLPVDVRRFIYSVIVATVIVLYRIYGVDP